MPTGAGFAGRGAVACCGVEGVARAAVCPRVRDRRDAAGPSSRASEHPEATARSRRGLQPRAAAPPCDRRRHAAQPSGPGGGPVSRPGQAIARPVAPSGAFLDALDAALVDDAIFVARQEHPLIHLNLGDLRLRLLRAPAAGPRLWTGRAKGARLCRSRPRGCVVALPSARLPRWGPGETRTRE